MCVKRDFEKIDASHFRAGRLPGTFRKAQIMQGFRTYIAAFLMVAFGVLASTDWVSFLADPKAGLVAIGSGILMAVMRTITATPPTTPPAQK